MDKKELMRKAVMLSEKSVKNGGGPFGAIIVKDGNIVAEASNSVTIDNDPTAHAEVNAIRKATSKLGTFDLQGCDIYTSCEPCPMCLGAIYWARLDNIYYANDRKDAARIGFDDDFIYKEIALKPSERSKHMEILLPEEGIRAFQMWEHKTDKTEY
ncbi:MAG TPA: tRNA-specific adenosine deaminase [Prevotella sp.]|nr:tRNA-specific adenosine deaminase [Prevotella sp.]